MPPDYWSLTDAEAAGWERPSRYVQYRSGSDPYCMHRYCIRLPSSSTMFIQKRFGCCDCGALAGFVVTSQYCEETADISRWNESERRLDEPEGGLQRSRSDTRWAEGLAARRTHQEVAELRDQHPELVPELIRRRGYTVNPEDMLGRTRYLLEEEERWLQRRIDRTRNKPGASSGNVHYEVWFEDDSTD